MLRICDICGKVDEKPRNVILCSIAEAPPVNQAMVLSILQNDEYDEVLKAAIIQDLHDNTLMLRHLDEEADAGYCVPFPSN